MKASEKRVVDLTLIDPLSTESYLRAWTREGSFRDVESYWRFADGDRDLVLPLRTDFGDFALRMSEVVESLSEVEDRSQSDIIAELRTANMDVVSLRVLSEEMLDGSISLSGGVELFERARQMLVFAARAAVERRAQFLGGRGAVGPGSP